MMIKNISWMAVLTVVLLLAACSGSPEAATEPQEQEPPQEQAQEQSQEQVQEQQEPSQNQPVDDLEGQPPTVSEAATTVMRSLKNGDMSQIAAWAHAEKGVRFSPYAYVDTKTDLVFKQDELEGLMKDPTERVWRTFAGSGEVIEMPYAEYHKQFVYDADFLEDAEISVNKVLGESTTVNNLNEVYSADQYDFVDYYIKGTDPGADGMDWRSLRLVFEKIGPDHALVGIVHDQWTP